MKRVMCDRCAMDLVEFLCDIPGPRFLSLKGETAVIPRRKIAADGSFDRGGAIVMDWQYRTLERGHRAVCGRKCGCAEKEAGDFDGQN